MNNDEKTPYLLRRITFNRAVDKNLIPNGSVIHGGSWWVLVALTEAQKTALEAAHFIVKPYNNEPL